MKLKNVRGNYSKVSGELLFNDLLLIIIINNLNNNIENNNKNHSRGNVVSGGISTATANLKEGISGFRRYHHKKYTLCTKLIFNKY